MLIVQHSPSVLNTLVTSPHDYNVSVLSRESSTYQVPNEVKPFKSDYAHESLVKALRGQEAVVSDISGPDLAAQQVKLIDAVIEGAKRFILSRVWEEHQSTLSRQILPSFNQRQETRDNLKSKEGQIEWTALLSDSS
jgi:hypothetical protein